MTTPPPVRRRPRAKTPPNFGRAVSEYHDGHGPPPPLPPRDMFSTFTTGSLPPLPSIPPPDIPPPVPSTPRPSLDTQVRSPTRSLRMSPPARRGYPDESESFTLSELVAKHSLLFPIKVRVTKGFFGERGEDSVIPVDEMYNVYFVKKAKVVTIRDSSRSKYIVPINSASKFGLIYKSPNFSETHVFETVEDLLLASPLPKIVSVQVAHQGQDEHTSVHKSEVLIIKGVHKPGRLKTMFRNQHEQLKVFSLKTMQEKMLTKDVFGRFTVDPQHTQLYLPELLKYVDNPVPSSAKLFLDYNSGDPLPDLLVSGIVKMEKVEIEVSVIASHACDFDDDDQHQYHDDEDRLSERMIDIPVSLDIEVSVLPPQDVSDEGDYDYFQLYDDAMTLVRQFDPHNLSRFGGSEDYSYVTQNRFFNAVRKGHEKEGLDIVFPKIRKNAPLSSSSSSDYVGPDVIDDYEECVFDQPSTSGPAHSKVDNAKPVTQQFNQQHPPSADYYVNSGMTPPPVRPRSANPPPASSVASTSAYDVPPKRQSPYDVPPKSPRRSVTELEPDVPPPLPPPRSISKESIASRRKPSLPSPGPTQEPPSPRYVPQALPPRSTTPTAVTADTSGPTLTEDTSREDLSSQVGELQKSISEITTRVAKLEGDSSELPALKRDVSELKPLVQKLQTSSDSVQSEVSLLRKEVEEMRLQMKSLLMASAEGAIGSRAEETVSLEELNNQQVLQLLDSLSLQRYKAMFETKGIDGHTLSKYTEDRLFNELMVVSRSDRIKLMKVVNAKFVKMVPGADGANYVAFEKAN